MVTVDQVMNRLADFGIETEAADRDVVQFELDLILNYTVNFCAFQSRDDIPELWDERIIDRVCSEYLMKQKNAGNLEGFNYEGFIKQVKEGDTTISWGDKNNGETPESRFDDFVNYLQRGYDKWIVRRRRLTW